MQAAWAAQQGAPRYGLPADLDPLEGWIVTRKLGFPVFIMILAVGPMLASATSYQFGQRLLTDKCLPFHAPSFIGRIVGRVASGPSRQTLRRRPGPVTGHLCG
jgi:hypothetical protein